jgi:hypothetical protein
VTGLTAQRSDRGGETQNDEKACPSAQRRDLMEKIVLVCREPEDHEHTIAMIEEMFPECVIEIVTESGESSHAVGNPFENMGSSFQIAPFFESY